MADSNRGQFSALWLPDKPADAVVSAPSVIASIGSLRDRLEVGYNHPAAIPGCLALYDFTDESTAIVYDKSDGSFDLTTVGVWTAANFIDTMFGKAYRFDGTDYATVVSFILNGAFTMEAVFRVNSDSINNRWIMEVKDAIYPSYLYQQGNGLDGDLRFKCYGAEFGTGFLAVDHLNEIVHFAVIYDGTDATAWVNGLKLGTSAVTTKNTTNTLSIGGDSAGANLSDHDMMALRICNRALDPSEFMHHWYLKSLVNGNHGGSSVLFDPQISAFPKRKSHLITVNWKREPKLEWANLMVNNKKGGPTAVLTPNVDMTELYIGGLPIVDEDTIGYWVFDGTKASDGVTAGFVKDWSGRSHVGTLVGLTDSDLVNKKYGLVYDLAGATKYISVPDHDDLSFVNFSAETAFVLDTLSSNQAVFSKEEAASTREYLLLISVTGQVIVYVFETDGNDFLTFTVSAGLAAGIFNTVGFAFVENGSSSTCVIVINGVPYFPSPSETGTYTGMVNTSSELWIGRRLAGGDPIDGKVFYLRLSKIVRETDELIYNSLNFYKRANGVIQDLWLT